LGKTTTPPVFVKESGNHIDVGIEVKAPGVYRGLYQVSTEPFSSGADWQNPPGLVSSGYVQLAFARSRNPGLISLNNFSISLSKRGVIPHSTARSGNSRTGAKYTAVQDAKKIYVRMLALDENNRPSFGSSNVLEAELRAPLVFKDFRLSPDYVSSFKWIRARQTSADFYRRVVVTSDISSPFGGILFTKGQKLYLTPSSGGGSDPFSDFISAAGNALGSFIDAAGHIIGGATANFFQIKNAIVAMCENVASEIIKTADQEVAQKMFAILDESLACAGMPPAFSNADAFIKDTAYYTRLYTSMLHDLFLTVASIPQNAVQDSAEKIVKAMFAQVKSSNDAVLFRPDPDFMYRPSSLVVVVRNGTGKTSRLTPLDITDASGYFEPVRPLIPPLAPGEEISIQVFFKPTLDPDRWLKFKLPTYPMPDFGSIWNLSNPDGGPLSAFKSSAKKSSSQQKYLDEVAAYFAALQEQENLRKAWEKIYVYGIASGGSVASAELSFAMNGKILHKLSQKLGD
jgi:carbon monoxide dehydrogenase subunit G